MGLLLITSSGEGVGRTAFSAGLARLLSQQGLSPALFKPLRITTDETDGLPDPDAAFFASLAGSPSADSWPVSVTAEEAREGLKPTTLTRVTAALDQVAGQADGVIAEVPPEVAAQLAESLDAQVVGLLRYGPKLRVEEGAVLARSFGQRLLGVVVNRVTRYRHSTVRSSLVPALEAQGLRVLGVVPEERRMLGVTVGELADHLKGEFLLWEEKRDQLVDHLLIGGLVLESGADYFGRSERKAVIVRGDRPDIQMVALGTPTRCLVLTGGHHPIQYVTYEAQEEEVPLVLVQSDTLTAARDLEALFQGTTVHHPDKADCFAQLLAESVDVEALKSVLASS